MYLRWSSISSSSSKKINNNITHSTSHCDTKYSSNILLIAETSPPPRWHELCDSFNGDGLTASRISLAIPISRWKPTYSPALLKCVEVVLTYVSSSEPSATVSRNSMSVYVYFVPVHSRVWMMNKGFCVYIGTQYAPHDGTFFCCSMWLNQTHTYTISQTLESRTKRERCSINIYKHNTTHTHHTISYIDCHDGDLQWMMLFLCESGRKRKRKSERIWWNRRRMKKKTHRN